MTTSTKKILLSALVVPAIALAAACTGGSDADKTATASVDKAAPAPATAPGVAPEMSNRATANLADGVDSFSNTGGQATSLARQGEPQSVPEETEAETKSEPQIQGQSVISKGQISLRSKDIDKTRFELQKLLDTLDGTIADEQSSADKKGRTIRQRLVLRVPSARFGKAMDGISALKPGTLISRNRSSQDVTTKVIDNATRVRTQRASLARVQALLTRASSLREIISIEAQLSRRQAELDSLEAQQKYLADQTSLSTINVYLTVPDKKKESGHEDDGGGFFSGLKSGWDSLGTSTTAVLTGIGAVLPFAVLLALIGFPAWAAWRRRTVHTAPAEA